MSTIGASPHFSRSLYSDIFNDKRISVKHLHFSVALCILQQLKKDVCTFPWPTTLRPLVSFTLEKARMMK